MHVVIIGGASTIGVTVTYTLISANPTLDVTLVDPDEATAWGHSLDITHSRFHSAGAPVDAETADSFGTVRSVGVDELANLDPDIVVFTAAAPQPADATDADARAAELEANRAIVDDVAGGLRTLDPVPVLVLSNPIDRITYRLWKRLGWSRDRFIGYSLSETSRTAYRIGELQDVHPATVSCPVMGEHGEGIVPIFSRLRINGEPMSLPEPQRADVRGYVRAIPFEIAKERGVSETSRWVTSAGVARLIRAMSTDGTATLCLSTPVDGEYGLVDGCLSVPVSLTTTGVDEIIEWDLSDDENRRLRSAHSAIRADIEL
ncbi:malate dehydrogenase [Halosolutus gelatinilyticus]|uniref:malate dehydrogenase n=1 Tax=Halosolutus gelatinilyticus TaxID=2931975 RepID=UPI001FF0F465|nr:lactate dehydrogenase [Halosolutus gelatinilyticus]